MTGKTAAKGGSSPPSAPASGKSAAAASAKLATAKFEHDHHDIPTLIDAFKLHATAKDIQKVTKSIQTASEKIEKFGELSARIKEGEAARRQLQAVGQMSYDVRRMRRGLKALENVAREGGNRGAKARASLESARAALLQAEESYRHERGLVHESHGALESLKQMSGFERFQGNTFTNIEHYLSQSRIGSALMRSGKILSNKHVLKGLFVLNTALAFSLSYREAPNTRATAKAAFATANVATELGVDAATKSIPILGVADFAIKHTAGEEFTLGTLYKGGNASVCALAESLLTHDSRPLDKAHEEAMKGSYGPVHKAAAEAGEWWSERGLIGGLKEFGESVIWWAGHG